MRAILHFYWKITCSAIDDGIIPIFVTTGVSHKHYVIWRRNFPVYTILWTHFTQIAKLKIL